MGILLQPNLQKRHTLDSRVLIGRSRKCDLRLAHPSISGEHALIWWDSGQWLIRDLGSRNGTRIGEALITTDQDRSLSEGDVLTFGKHPVRWTVESAAPPVARAIPLDGAPVSAEDDMLVLPDPEAPLALVYTDPLQGWVMESGDDLRPVHDQELITLADRVWRLHLPSPLSRTVDLSGVGAALSSLTLRFRISADEEHVHLSAIDSLQTHDLGARAHNYALLLLARRRQEDAGDPDLSRDARGWMYPEELAGMLRLTRTHLNLLIFRARKQLTKLGVTNASEIIERRADTRQIRLGPVQLDIQSV